MVSFLAIFWVLLSFGAFQFVFSSPDDEPYTLSVDENKFQTLMKKILGNSTSTTVPDNVGYLNAPKYSLVDNRYILSFDPNCSLLNSLTENMHEMLSFLSCSMKYEFGSTLQGCHIEFKPTDAHAKVPLDLLKQLPCLKAIEETQTMKVSQIQSSVPWGLDRIDQASPQLNQKYQFTLSGKNIHVYVIDSGIDTSHPEFRGRVELAYTVSSLSEEVRRNSTDCSGHGTHVSGIIAGNIVGVAKNALIHAVRVIGCDDSTNADVIEAIDFIIKTHKKPAVINMSLGALPDPITGDYKPIPSLDDAIKRAIDAGISVVVAAGNYNINVCTGSPSNIPSLIVVGASGQNTQGQDVKAPFSNYGPCVDIFAPGTNVVSSFPGGKYASLSGSSQASPHVTGVVAQILESLPNSLPAEVERLLLNISTKDVVTTLPGTTSSLLRTYNNKNIPMDAFVTNILTYSDSLMNLLQPNSFRLSITVIVIICIFSFLALLLLFYIFFKLVYQVRNKGSKPTKQNLENGKITSPPKNNSLSPPIPVFKSKRASFAEFKESSEKSIILGSAPSLRLPPLKSKATLPSEKRLSSENLDKLPAYLSKPSVTMASNFSSVYTTESPRESDFSFRESNITNDSDRIEEESTLSVISSYQFKTLEREAPPLLPTAPPSILLRNGWSVSSSTYQNASPYSESGSYPEFPPLPPNPESVSTNLDLEENHDDSLLLQPSSFPIQSETLLYPNPIISHEENNLGSTDQKPNDSDPSLTSSSTLKPTSNPKTSPLSVRTTYSLFPRLTSYANPFDITDFLDDLKN